MANLYESLPAGLKNAQPPPPPPPATPPPRVLTPNPANPPRGRPPKNNNQAKGRGHGAKKPVPLRVGAQPPPPPPPLPPQPLNEPPRVITLGGAAPGAAPGVNGEQDSGKSEILKSGKSGNQQSEAVVGGDNENPDEQAGDPGFDLANDVETNENFAIRVARERKQRRRRERSACLVIIVMISIGAVLTLATSIFISLDLSNGDDAKES